MKAAERTAHGICLSVTDQQASALRTLRALRADPGLYFSRYRYRDGARVVIDAMGIPAVTMLADGRSTRWDRE